MKALGWLRFVVLLVTIISTAALFGNDDDDEEGADRPAPADKAEHTIPNEMFDERVFGKAFNPAAAGSQITTILSNRLKTLDEVFGLTNDQKQKLQLAGRGDIERILDRAQALREKVRFEMDEAHCRESVLAMRRLQREFRAGPFGDGSLFAKSLRTGLSDAQAPRFEAMMAIQRRYETLYETIQVIELAGGGIRSDPQSPDDVRSVQLSGCQLTDADLKHVKTLPNLVALDLSNTKVTDVGIAELRGLSKLENLSLRGTKLTDAGLEHVGHLASLESLDLGSTGVCLKDFPKLEALTLPCRNISDAGLVHLEKLRQLTNLRLYDTCVSDKGVVGLGGLTNLVLLDLRRTKVTAAGISQLRSLPNLQVLEGP